jgi:hypothetical protein
VPGAEGESATLLPGPAPAAAAPAEQRGEGSAEIVSLDRFRRK